MADAYMPHLRSGKSPR